MTPIKVHGDLHDQRAPVLWCSDSHQNSRRLKWLMSSMLPMYFSYRNARRPNDRKAPVLWCYNSDSYSKRLEWQKNVSHQNARRLLRPKSDAIIATPIKIHGDVSMLWRCLLSKCTETSTTEERCHHCDSYQHARRLDWPKSVNAFIVPVLRSNATAPTNAVPIEQQACRKRQRFPGTRTTWPVGYSIWASLESAGERGSYYLQLVIYRMSFTIGLCADFKCNFPTCRLLSRGGGLLVSL